AARRGGGVATRGAGAAAGRADAAHRYSRGRAVAAHRQLEAGSAQSGLRRGAESGDCLPLRSRPRGAIPGPPCRGPLMIGRRRIAEFLMTNRLPSIYSFHEHVQAGGLMAYVANYHATYRRNMALVIDKIFMGSKPGDLPVQQPTEFELILNLKTAKAL